MTDVTLKSGIKEFGFLLQDKGAWLSTRKVATIFGKDHAKVLRTVANLIKNDDKFSKANFGLSKYKDASGKTNKEYLLNSKSFTLVAMGFNGEEALKFKKDYIDAFENMRELIITRELSKDGYKLMGEAIKTYLDDNHNPYLYSNEANMINKLVLGMTAKKFKELNNLDKNDANRDHYAISQLDIWDKCQRFNAQLISIGVDFKERKEMLVKFKETFNDYKEVANETK